TENALVQMRKGILEFCILHIISRGEVYDSDILEELTTAKIMVVEGMLYPLLTRLKNAGFLDYKCMEFTSSSLRKYYVLTEKRREFLVAKQSTRDELQQTVTTIIGKTDTNQKSTDH